MIYKDSSCPIEERIEDLLSRMTIKEKVGQLNQRLFGWNAYVKTEQGIDLSDEFKQEVEFGEGMGALYGLFRSDPWSGVTYENGIPLHKNAQVANMVQKYVLENTRLGIPVLLSEECPHGHQALDGTLIPTNIGVGSTWNDVLMEEAYSHMAKEIRARGGHLGLISTLDIVRDPRWGRSEECFSEDPYLASKMTEAVVNGLQGKLKNGQLDPDRVVAVLKHFCAQGSAEGGLNAAPASIGERELREIHLPAMKAGVKAGTLGCMAAYNEIDGVPCHANKNLLTNILREEMFFDGVVMADGVAIDRLLALTGEFEGAAALALEAGVDLGLWDTSFSTLEKAVEEGKTTEEYLDRAVRRVLGLKFKLGLFENPYIDEAAYIDVVGSESFERVNLQIARESAVLLKNDDSILPLKKNLRKVAVIGPNADVIYNQLGDYTAIQADGKGVTVLEGVKKVVSKNTEVLFAKGCGIRNTSKDGFEEAIAIAKDAEVAILVLGGSSARNFDLEFDTNGAAIVDGNPTEMDCGEGLDLADLRLGGVQAELVKEIAATGKPVITVLIQGRPHAISNITDYSDAIVCAWYPGQQGGKAIGEILFGDVNPSGKLSVSIPKSSYQLPVYYNRKEQGRELLYTDLDAAPLFPFGYGISYTKFEYSDLKLSNYEVSLGELESEKVIKVSVNVKNVGSTAGGEVVQLYIKDMEASITRRVKELKGFKKVWLEPGEQKTVVMELSEEELAIWNADMKFCVESGNVKVMVGGSSMDTNEVALVVK